MPASRINFSSIAFAETIGRLYMAEKDHKKLLELKMKLTLNDIKERFNIHFHDVDSEVMQKISLNGKIPLEEVEDIFRLYNFFLSKNESMTASELVTFYKRIEEFKTKIS